MKVLLCLLIAALVAIGALAAGRPSFAIEPLNWITATTGGMPYVSLAASGDLLVYFDYQYTPYAAVRRRNSEGGYDQVANITRYIDPQVRTAHGKWIWMQNGGIALWKIDANNQLTEESFIETTGGSMLSDDTFVGYSDGQILTFEYQAEYNNWTAIAGAELNFTSSVYAYYDVQSYRAYDNYLVIADTAESSIKIYLRQADKSWKLNDTITVPTLGPNVGVHFNGVDTVLFIGTNTLSDGSQGIVYIYTKNNGTWNEQMFNSSSVGYIGQTNLGASCAFIDQNTLIVSAGTADYYARAPFRIGKVLMMTRTNGGDWTPHIDIVGDDSDVFGMSIAINDYDLLVHDVSLYGPNNQRFRVFTAPLCFAQPINVTCNNQQLNDCSSLSQAQLYTVNQSRRCGAITPLLNGVSLIDQKLQASFTFTRFEIESFSCNATVTCPAPVVPVAVSAPVKAPTAKVSGASMIQCFSLAVLMLSIATVWMA